MFSGYDYESYSSNCGQQATTGKQPTNPITMKYGEITFGQMEAIINKLGGMDGVQRFLSGETVVKAIETTFKVWKTILLGTYKDADALKKTMKETNCKVGDWANDIMGKPAFFVTSFEKKIQLVNVSVAELGFKNSATYKDICARAEELGLGLCPNEVGPQLRLQYKDQPKGEWLRIAMEPIADSDGHLNIFKVEHLDDVLWLNGNIGHPDLTWLAGNRFAFCLRK
jgi:hypothetical protein